ncbi:molybdopterin-binding protein [Loktanella sp. 5RATIMAR09]|nr:molybdopterin-binding protein [Loktanella sp. 5RATIMAR09]
MESQTCGCDRLTDKIDLISVDDAILRIARATQAVVETEEIDLMQAAGRVLARSVRSLGMVPPFDNSAMDGYAIKSADLNADGPWDLRVADRVAAGQSRAEEIPANTAVQIFTGAPIPRGADTVVMQEDVERSADRIVLKNKAKTGAHIRKAGEDMIAGKIIVPTGRRLTARDIAACAAAGHGTVSVYRRIRIALLVTGDEVRQPGQVRGSAGIWDVNTPMLSAVMIAPHVELCGVHHAADTRSALRAQLSALAEQADIVVTTGGISVGEEDHVKPVLADLGATIDFSGVALKPGKPVSFGKYNGTYWLGLPGNPLSAFVTWQVFGIALCNALSGMTYRSAQRRHVVLSRTVNHKPGRCEFRLARLAGFDGTGREIVEFEDATHSGRVAQLPDMDGLLFIPADAEALPAGALVEFQPF